MIISILRLTYGLSLLFLCTSQVGAQRSIYVNNFPYTQSFEDPNDLWRQPPYAPIEWELNSGATTTPNTGPSAASDGSNYLYVEATNQRGTAALASHGFDFTQLQNPYMSFDYHMYGADALTLRLTTFGRIGGAQNQLILTGNQGNTWQTANIELFDYQNDTRFFFYVYGSVFSQTGDKGDIAIDNFFIGENPQCAGLQAAYRLNTNNISCVSSNDGSANVQFFVGTAADYTIEWSTGDTGTSIANLSVGDYEVTITDNNTNCRSIKSFTISDDPMEANLLIFPESFAGSADGFVDVQVSGGRPPYIFAWSNGGSASSYIGSSGSLELRIEDANTCRITVPVYVPVQEFCATPNSNLPYASNFESSNLILFNQVQADDLDWTRNTNGTPTAGTGPNRASEGSYYGYLEASGTGNPRKTGVLRTCVDISSFSFPALFFNYHMGGNQMGSLSVQVSIDGGFTWQNAPWSAIGNQGMNWEKTTIDLNTYASFPSLMIDIIGNTGYGELSDIAIDNIQIFSNPPSNNNTTVSRSESIVVDKDKELTAFPNPATDLLMVKHRVGIKQIYIMNLQGQLVQTYSAQQTATQLEVSTLTAGIYFVVTQDEAGKTLACKFTKQ